VSANQYLLEAQTRHQIYLQRLGGSQAKKLTKEVERIIKQVAGEIATTDWQYSRQQQIIQEFVAFLNASYAEMTGGLYQEMIDLVDYEVGYQFGLIGGAVTAELTRPSIDTITRLLEFKAIKVKVGATSSMKDVLKDFERSQVKALEQVIRDGLVLGETGVETAKKVQATLSIRKSHADTIARTMINAASAHAKDSFYQENKDIIPEVRYVATLDGRTRIDHMGKDGKVFALDDGQKPSLPDGFNCRCVYVPVIPDRYQKDGFEGQRPANGDETSTVSSRVNYEGFLRTQSKEFQNEVLGVKRAKLWRSGKVKLSDMTDRFGKELTLDELKSLEGV
jgi:SPP1 gp7 family putative phage head morphogenesis protein